MAYRDITEDKEDEWLNAEVPGRPRFIVHYPNGDVRGLYNCVFKKNEPGDIVYSDFIAGELIVAEKSEDGKRIWLEYRY